MFIEVKPVTGKTISNEGDLQINSTLFKSGKGDFLSIKNFLA